MLIVFSKGRSSAGFGFGVVARARRWALLARALERCGRAFECARALRGAESKVCCRQLSVAFSAAVARGSLTARSRSPPRRALSTRGALWLAYVWQTRGARAKRAGRMAGGTAYWASVRPGSEASFRRPHPSSRTGHVQNGTALADFREFALVVASPRAPSAGVQVPAHNLIGESITPLRQETVENTTVRGRIVRVSLPSQASLAGAAKRSD